MTPVYNDKLGFGIQKIDVGAQKINSTTLVTYGMVIGNLSF